MNPEKRLGLPKAFMCCSNVVFLMSGFLLMSFGAVLLLDSDKILLSRMISSSEIYPEHPMFYYVALVFVAVGFFISVTGLLGCWASCLHNHCITALYVVVLLALVLIKCALCVTIVFQPQILGINLQAGRLLRNLQRSYALPGHEQFTAALDLAQVAFSCCGINSSSNYGTSWWRLQELNKRELVVPLSCCALNNVNDPDSFLNPVPRNLSLCQSLNPVQHQESRHTTGCLLMIESWLQEQTLILLAISFSVILIELCALLSTALACLKKNKPIRRTCGDKKSHKHASSCFTSTQTLSPFCSMVENEQDYAMNCGINSGMEIRSTIAGNSFAGKSKS